MSAYPLGQIRRILRCRGASADRRRRAITEGELPPGMWIIARLKGTPAPAPDTLPPMSTTAHLCATCGFGPKASQCIACGAPFAETPAQLCSSCGFGPAAQQCVKCRKPFANIAARLCRTCGFGPRAQACIKCGRMF